MRKLVLLAVSLAFLVAPAAAMADDLNPPDWRGMPGTTSQVWEFTEPAPNPILPDGPAIDPPGLPPLASTMIYMYPGENRGWLDWDYERQGVWELSGRMDVVVDNLDPPNDEKWIQVQLTWRPTVAGAEPYFDYWNPPYSVMFPVEEINLSDGWTHSTYNWWLDWNPPDETFGIAGEINIDELVVDTWCVPEPSTFVSLIGLVMMAGFVFLRRGK